MIYATMTDIYDRDMVETLFTQKGGFKEKFQKFLMDPTIPMEFFGKKISSKSILKVFKKVEGLDNLAKGILTSRIPVKYVFLSPHNSLISFSRNVDGTVNFSFPCSLELKNTYGLKFDLVYENVRRLPDFSLKNAKMVVTRCYSSDLGHFVHRDGTKGLDPNRLPRDIITHNTSRLGPYSVD